jgi:hypothetical protein
MKQLTSIIYIFLFSVLGFSQKIDELSTTFHLKQDGKSMNFTILDSDKKPPKKYCNEKYYYWYKAQNVIKTQGGSSGNLLNGKFNSFYLNKQLCEQGSFSMGLKDGKWNYWAENGILIRTENWKNGKLIGLQIDYDIDGTIRKKTIIGKLKQTDFIGDTIVLIHRSKRQIVINNEKGEKIEHKRYKNDLLHGKQEVISNGEKSIAEFKKGVLVEKKEKSKELNSDQKTEKKSTNFFKKIFKKKEKTETDPKEEKPKKEKKKLFPLKKKP